MPSAFNASMPPGYFVPQLCTHASVLHCETQYARSTHDVLAAHALACAQQLEAAHELQADEFMSNVLPEPTDEHVLLGGGGGDGLEEPEPDADGDGEDDDDEVPPPSESPSAAFAHATMSVHAFCAHLSRFASAASL